MVLLKRHNIYYLIHSRYGFKSGHSTRGCCIDLLNNVGTASDKGLHVAVVYLDFSKAFSMYIEEIVAHPRWNPVRLRTEVQVLSMNTRCFLFLR